MMMIHQKKICNGKVVIYIFFSTECNIIKLLGTQKCGMYEKKQGPHQ